MQTVLITGCSSGFGLEIAKYFLARDWHVIATMRKPREGLLPLSDRLQILALDVTDPQSIRQAFQDAGPVDVLVNNAGIGLLSAFEEGSMALFREVFEVNTLGTFRVTQAVLPQFRQRKSGVIVNVTSSITLKPFPLLSVYTASKAAVDAFTESLALELQPFNIRMNLVLPGRSPETAFGQNAQSRMAGGIPPAYADFAHGIFSAMGASSASLTHALDVAQAVWRAATDPTCPLRLPAGADAVVLAESC